MAVRRVLCSAASLVLALCLAVPALAADYLIDPELRPAYPDNLPRIGVRGGRISVNGLYRHGFLIAPALAELTLSYVERGQIDNEVMQCA